MKVVRILSLTPPMAKDFPCFLADFLSAAVWRAFFMEIFVTKYPICRYRSLRLFLGLGIDHIFDLIARRIHRFKLECWHGSRPLEKMFGYLVERVPPGAVCFIV